MRDNEAGSLDFIQDAVDDLEASGRNYIVIVSHGEEYILSGNLSKEHAFKILEFTQSNCIKEILTEISNES